MPGMSDSAWLPIIVKAGTPTSETLTEAQSAQPLQKDVDNLLVTVSFSLDDPDPETAFNVLVKWRRADVKVSTMSAEQKRELVEAKDKELSTFVKNSVVRRHRVKGSHRLH